MELKDFRKKNLQQMRKKVFQLLSTQNTLLAGMKMAKTLKHHYFYLLYLLKKEASTK